ncbi:MAG: hypothetical protein ACFFCV_02500 [Promethearchaeota archaeon]
MNNSERTDSDPLTELISKLKCFNYSCYTKAQRNEIINTVNSLEKNPNIDKTKLSILLGGLMMLNLIPDNKIEKDLIRTLDYTFNKIKEEIK